LRAEQIARHIREGKPIPKVLHKEMEVIKKK